MDNLKHLIHKIFIEIFIEITNLGVWNDCIRVTEKSRLLFDDEVCNLHKTSSQIL